MDSENVIDELLCLSSICMVNKAEIYEPISQVSLRSLDL